MPLPGHNPATCAACQARERWLARQADAWIEGSDRPAAPRPPGRHRRAKTAMRRASGHLARRGHRRRAQASLRTLLRPLGF